MSKQTSSVPKEGYDSRWFIWTIVFLVVTGISLVSYIVLSSNSNNDSFALTVPIQHVPHKTARK